MVQSLVSCPAFHGMKRKKMWENPGKRFFLFIILLCIFYLSLILVCHRVLQSVRHLWEFAYFPHFVGGEQRFYCQTGSSHQNLGSLSLPPRLPPSPAFIYYQTINTEDQSQQIIFLQDFSSKLLQQFGCIIAIPQLINKYEYSWVSVYVKMNSILQKFHHYSEMVVLRGLTLLIFIDFCRIFIITMSRFFMHLIIGSVCRKFVSATLFTEMVEFGNWIIYLGLVIFSSKDDEWTKYDSSLAFVLFRHLRYCAIIGTKLRADFEAWLVGSLRWDCGSFWFSSVGSFKTSYCKLSIISEKIWTIYFKI